MRSVGIEVTIPSKERPAASVVVLEGTPSNPVLVDEIPLTSSADVLPTMLLDLANGLESALSGLNADRVVIRQAGFSRASNFKGPKIRRMAEGALVVAARRKCTDVIVDEAKDLAGRAGLPNQAALDAAGAAICPGQQNSAAAALAGLVP